MDLSDELLVYRFGNGIKLLRPDHVKKMKLDSGRYTEHTIESLLKLPMCSYFDNLDIVIQKTNELNAEACGFNSVSAGKGKSVFDFFSSELAQYVFNKDIKMLREKNKQIIEEEGNLIDEIQYQALSFKFPLYGDNNDILGMFGFSVMLGKQPLSQSLMHIANLGLLNNTTKILPGAQLDNIYLSKRELECLKLALRGKSSKQTAAELKISSRTVEEYLNNIKLKLGVFSKAELIDKTLEYLGFEF
ncbi:transcriptional regulator LuxR [Legionella wadsworthii]|uniref:Transcriptional regulator LuxR n=2 Tax=Legionella wadsworthii TaxID=28088 RepID=A0A378LUI7_9GAMM|nr:transcriptional regulator LuxR [Legionella wadsworthii]